ncbi:hypothetical protein F5B19DRAFT_501649 [Rostrohypoxylon terebratum]|nr:hypothetical protein F5B19DRAFT_501649 [Rostrohypoxylon terebratum]
MPDGKGRGASAVGVSGHTIYLAGGLERFELTTNGTKESLDIVTHTILRKGRGRTYQAFRATRDHVGDEVIGRTFYIVEGRDHGQPNVRNMAWTLDLDELPSGWSAMAEMPTAREGLSIGVIDDYVATFGGEGNPAPNSNGVFDETEVYDTKSYPWFKLATLPHPRHGTVAASVHGRIYIPGGGISIGAGPVDTFDGFETINLRAEYLVNIAEAVECINYLAFLEGRSCVASINGEWFCRRGRTQITGLLQREGGPNTATCQQAAQAAGRIMDSCSRGDGKVKDQVDLEFLGAPGYFVDIRTP